MIFIEELFKQENALILAVFSSPLDKNKKSPSKVSIRPLVLKNQTAYQISSYVAEKVFHNNLSPEECNAFINYKLLPAFKKAIFYTTKADHYLSKNNKGIFQSLNKPPTKALVTSAQHNRQKNYILAEGEPIAFLIALGIMNTEGQVLAKKRDKFRQINRFLEMVLDLLPHFKDTKSLNIIDFGCGKAYLSFAVYYVLKFIHGFEVKLLGLDLKADVMRDCQKLADTLGYTGLTFELGNIADHSTIDPEQELDLIISLHACDTASDLVIEKAINSKAKAILVAPCCQHELAKQIQSEPLNAILEHGILKERLAALVTDAARAKILEIYGYKTQLLEFIDPEHTPKNLLIRAVYTEANKINKKHRELAQKSYLDLKDSFNIFPKLESLLTNLD